MKKQLNKVVQLLTFYKVLTAFLLTQTDSQIKHNSRYEGGRDIGGAKEEYDYHVVAPVAGTVLVLVKAEVVVAVVLLAVVIVVVVAALI